MISWEAQLNARSYGIRATFVAGLLALCASGCGSSTTRTIRANDVSAVRHVVDPSVPFPDVGRDRPFAFIWVSPAYSPTAVCGIAVAIWDDGTVVRAASDQQIGKRYVRGKLNADQLASVRRMLAESGILNSKQGEYLVGDARSDWLYLRWGEAMCNWAHSPGFERTGNADSTNPQLTRLTEELLKLTIDHAVAEPPEEWTAYPREWIEGRS